MLRNMRAGIMPRQSLTPNLKSWKSILRCITYKMDPQKIHASAQSHWHLKRCSKIAMFVKFGGITSLSIIRITKQRLK